MAADRRVGEKMKENERVVVVEGATPKSGTELTRERMSKHLRSLNSGWTKKTNEGQANS
jgi:hypothetical protein